MLRRHFFFSASVAGLLAHAPVAREADHDGRFPTTLTTQFNGKPVRLTLTGTARRTKYWMNVYAVGSYVQEGVKVRSPEALAASDAPKILHLIFERDVDGATMAGAFRESIGRSHPAPAFAGELAALERHFIANPVKKGDHVWLTHIPGVGLGVGVNQKPAGVVKGVAFAHAAWGTYLGPNHLGVAIKTGLTSRL